MTTFLVGFVLLDEVQLAANEEKLLLGVVQLLNEKLYETV